MVRCEPQMGDSFGGQIELVSDLIMARSHFRLSCTQEHVNTKLLATTITMRLEISGHLHSGEGKRLDILEPSSVPLTVDGITEIH
jgi:hypothetical protein